MFSLAKEAEEVGVDADNVVDEEDGVKNDVAEKENAGGFSSLILNCGTKSSSCLTLMILFSFFSVYWPCTPSFFISCPVYGYLNFILLYTSIAFFSSDCLLSD